ncbi:hypothetical protein ACODT3_43975 [Streptomyces sp. 4.24]|uniref:hypothetical protein n=1 Tax=Streptomyces tritrimontium TaxID=3406573 RepID=UPI003BB49BF9
MEEIQVVEESHIEDVAPDARAVLLWELSDQVQFGDAQAGGGVWVQRGVEMDLHCVGHQVGSLALPASSWGNAKDGAEQEAASIAPWRGTLEHLARAEYLDGRVRGGEYLLVEYDDACDEPLQWGRERRKDAEQSLKGWLGDAAPADDANLFAAAAERLEALRVENGRELTAALAAMPDPGSQAPIAAEWESAWAQRFHAAGLPTSLRYFTAVRLLEAWKMTQPAVSRDRVVRLALASDVSKAKISGLTGVARSTIDRILTADTLTG